MHDSDINAFTSINTDDMRLFLDKIPNPIHRAVIQAVLTTNFSPQEIAMRLKIKRKTIYGICYRYLPRGCLSARRDVLVNGKRLEKLQQIIEELFESNSTADNVVQVVDLDEEQGAEAAPAVKIESTGAEVPKIAAPQPDKLKPSLDAPPAAAVQQKTWPVGEALCAAPHKTEEPTIDIEFGGMHIRMPSGSPSASPDSLVMIIEALGKLRHAGMTG